MKIISTKTNLSKALFLLAFLTISCRKPPSSLPIEIYKDKRLILVDNPRAIYHGSIVELHVKSKTDVYFIYLTPFDAKNLKEGDTIK